MTLLEHDREQAAALDDADALRAFHTRFVVADDGLIYLDGNSLGRLPRNTQARLDEAIQGQWGQRLIRAWSEGWMELPHTLGDRLGAPARLLAYMSTTAVASGGGAFEPGVNIMAFLAT